MQHVAVVANPTKLDDADATRAELREIASRHDAELAWYDTTADDPGRGQTRQALDDGATLVCALGGDGTVRAVASELAGGDVPLGLLPGGTGNLLARNLHNPVDSIPDAFTVALTGRTDRIDVGRVAIDDREPEVFLVMAGLGLDAETMAGTSEDVKAKVGWVAYGLTGIRKLVGDGFDATVTVDGQRRRHRQVRNLMVGNCGMVQGDFEIFPDARVDDGGLDLMVLAPDGLVGWVRALARLVAQRRRGHGDLQHGSGHDIEVAVRRPVEAEVDGDAVGAASHLVFHVEQAVLPVRVTEAADVD